MAFEEIECVNPTKAAARPVPANGIIFSSRPINVKRAKTPGGGRYLRLAIGPDLAKKVSLTQDEQSIRLLFGTDVDAGKVRVSVPLQGGAFRAKRDRKGNYVVTINAATADGLFAMDFAPLVVTSCEALRPSNGQAPHFVFKASDDMLAAGD